MTAIPAEVLVLLASIREALDVPYPAGNADKAQRRARRDLLDARVSDVKAVLTGILAVPEDELAASAARLRVWTAEQPVTYPAYVSPGGDE